MPMKASGFPGSCMGKREYPEVRLTGRGGQRLDDVKQGVNQHVVHGLVVQNCVRAKGHDIL